MEPCEFDPLLDQIPSNAPMWHLDAEVCAGSCDPLLPWPPRGGPFGRFGIQDVCCVSFTTVHPRPNMCCLFGANLKQVGATERQMCKPLTPIEVQAHIVFTICIVCVNTLFCLPFNMRLLMKPLSMFRFHQSCAFANAALEHLMCHTCVCYRSP